MTGGPILWRELTTGGRRKDLFSGRAYSAIFDAVIVGACILVWDWWEWDRTSVSGAANFGLTTFGFLIVAQVIGTLGAIPVTVATTIATERDKKTLDALLATPLTNAEIVLGALGAGLVKYFTGLIAGLPIVVLVVLLGGIDPRLVGLAYLGLASTAFTLAALAITMSAGARNSRRATASTLFWMLPWFMPVPLVLLLPRFWPTVASWVNPILLWMLDSGPFAPAINLVGVIRRTTFIGSVFRMIALQQGSAVVLLLWAIWRLRPASRAVYDGEGRASLLRSLRTRRWKRPACYDNPVLWNEIHSTRGVKPYEVLMGQIVGLCALAFLAYITSWFALPAFAEVIERGYGPAPANVSAPMAGDLHPFARMIVNKLAPATGLYSSEPGHARLDFNTILRECTAAAAWLYVLMLTSAAAEGLASEKQQDTWLGLIVTPLAGIEILRAKMLGAVWRCTGVLFPLLAIWTVAVLAGALHPLGFLVALVVLATCTWFFAAFGMRISLWAESRKQAAERVTLPAMVFPSIGYVVPFLPSWSVSILVGAASMPSLLWAALISYDDLAAVRSTGTFPSLAALGINTGHGPAMIVATIVLGVAIHLIGALLLTRSMTRRFDEAVGRPIRAKNKYATNRLSQIQAPMNLTANL